MHGPVGRGRGALCRRRTRVILAVLALWVVSACGGDDTTSEERPTDVTETASTPIPTIAATTTTPAASPTVAETVAPAPGGTYTVQAGDTLFGIAQQLGVDFEQLAALNELTDPYTIFPGDELQIPG